MIGTIVFAIISIGSFAFFGYRIYQIRQNIFLGQKINRCDRKSERWKTMLLVAFGQQKMFQRPLPALLHLAIYSAFVITQIELIEIFIDGFSGSHRFFYPILGSLYTFVISFIEILSVFAFVATIAFLSRRNLLKIPRFVKPEMNGWPKLDANFILLFEFMLICFIFMMNGADEVLYNRGLTHTSGAAGQLGSFGFTISSLIGPAFFGNLSESTLHTLEQIGWWGHISMVFVFLAYLPFSKHLHILFAFPNVYYSNLEKKGKFTNMVSVTNEVKLMLDPNADPYATPADGAAPQRFGAKDIPDLTRKNLMDAYTCTECGRCTSVCPANITGKLLSPRKIMMDTRDRMEEVGNSMRKNGSDFQDGKSLVGNYITPEEIWACTSCNACVDACPVNIDPLSIIIDLRRYLVMEESKAPTELTGMFTNIENNGAPWQFSPADRFNWSNEA